MSVILGISLLFVLILIGKLLESLFSDVVSELAIIQRRHDQDSQCHEVDGAFEV